jgi:hypothetical protein
VLILLDRNKTSSVTLRTLIGEVFTGCADEAEVVLSGGAPSLQGGVFHPD